MVPFTGPPASSRSRLAAASCGLIVTGSAAWLTSQASWPRPGRGRAVTGLGGLVTLASARSQGDRGEREP